MYILRALASNDGQGIKALSEWVDVTSSAMTQMIDRLLEKGLVEKNENTDDRRSLKVSLSKKSVELIKKIREEHYKVYKDMFEPLTDVEIASLNSALSKITK